GARDREDETHDHEETVDGLGVRPANGRQSARRGLNAEGGLSIARERIRGPVLRKRRLRDSRRQSGQPCADLIRGDAGLRPPNDLEIPRRSLIERRGTIENSARAERYVDLRLFAHARAEEARIGDADDLEGMS